MQSLRINVVLEKPELSALVSMANAECRHPTEQLRYILREEARRRGLLDTEDTTEEQGQDSTTEEAGHAER